VASSRRHCRSGLVRGGESLVELLLEDSGGAAGWSGPVGRRSPGSTWVAARHTRISAISSAGTGVCGWAAQAGASAAALRRTASSATSCDRAFRYGPQSGSAASRWGTPGSHGNGPPGDDLVDVLDPRVDDSSLIMGACQLVLCGRGEQFRDRVGAGGG
jgi:hypothetical protein